MKKNYYFVPFDKERFYCVVDDGNFDFVMLVDTLGIVMTDTPFASMKFEHEEDAWALAMYLHEMTDGVWFLVVEVAKDNG